MNAESRPKLKIALTPLDKTIETFGWVMMVLLWGYTILNYTNLPDIIPTHFNVAGIADKYGSRGTIFILPIIGSVLFLGLSLLNRFPQIFNFPTKITEENALRQYTNATRLIRYLKFAILVVFSLLVYLTSRAATEPLTGIGSWVLPFGLAVILIPTLFAVVRSMRSK